MGSYQSHRLAIERVVHFAERDLGEGEEAVDAFGNEQICNTATQRYF
jgi:hypothetical protein